MNNDEIKEIIAASLQVVLEKGHPHPDGTESVEVKLLWDGEVFDSDYVWL